MNLVFISLFHQAPATGGGADGIAIQLTFPVVLTAVAMFGGLLLAALKLGTAAQEMRGNTQATNALAANTAKLVETMAADVVSLRIDRHLAKEKLNVLEGQTEVLESEVGGITKDMPRALAHLDRISQNTEGVKESIAGVKDAVVAHDTHMRQLASEHKDIEMAVAREVTDVRNEVKRRRKA